MKEVSPWDTGWPTSWSKHLGRGGRGDRPDVPVTADGDEDILGEVVSRELVNCAHRPGIRKGVLSPRRPRNNTVQWSPTPPSAPATPCRSLMSPTCAPDKSQQLRELEERQECLESTAAALKNAVNRLTSVLGATSPPPPAARKEEREPPTFRKEVSHVAPEWSIPFELWRNAGRHSVDGPPSGPHQKEVPKCTANRVCGDLLFRQRRHTEQASTPSRYPLHTTNSRAGPAERQGDGGWPRVSERSPPFPPTASPYPGVPVEDQPTWDWDAYRPPASPAPIDADTLMTRGFAPRAAPTSPIGPAPLSELLAAVPALPRSSALIEDPHLADLFRHAPSSPLRPSSRPSRPRGFTVVGSPSRHHAVPPTVLPAEAILTPTRSASLSPPFVPPRPPSPLPLFDTVTSMRGRPRSNPQSPATVLQHAFPSSAEEINHLRRENEVLRRYVSSHGSNPRKPVHAP
eukprot:Sspe_Gene.24217::Locus_9555_Transcript_1_1_Confidence_1.000_Length_1542::g.24217::m.24217